MHLKDLKSKNPSDLLKIAEDLKIENAGTLRKQDMIFSILKQMAQNKDAIYEILSSIIIATNTKKKKKRVLFIFEAFICMLTVTRE